MAFAPTNITGLCAPGALDGWSFNFVALKEKKARLMLKVLYILLWHTEMYVCSVKFKVDKAISDIKLIYLWTIFSLEEIRNTKDSENGGSNAISAGRDSRTDFESASRIKIAPLDIMGPFGLKPMCNDMPRQRERERDNVASFCRYRLLSTLEQRRGSASVLERPESNIPVSRKVYVKCRTHTDVSDYACGHWKHTHIYTKVLCL